MVGAPAPQPVLFFEGEGAELGRVRAVVPTVSRRAYKTAKGVVRASKEASTSVGSITEGAAEATGAVK